MPLKNRNVSIHPYDGASAVKTFAAPKAVISQMSKTRRDPLAARSAITGAPTTTPQAYALMT